VDDEEGSTIGALESGIMEREKKSEDNIRLKLEIGVKKRAGYALSCGVRLAVCPNCTGNKDQWYPEAQIIFGANMALHKRERLKTRKRESIFKIATHDWATGDVLYFQCTEGSEYFWVGPRPVWVGELPSGDSPTSDANGNAIPKLRRGIPFSGTVKLRTRKGPRRALHIRVEWEKCNGDCDDMPTTMAALSDAVYSRANQVGNWHHIYGADISDVAGKAGEDLISLYKQRNRNNCALVFSGTNNIRDWTNNVDAFTTMAMCGHEEIHRGFATKMQGYFMSPTMKTIGKLVNLFCNRAVNVVGHSLGGSVASIAAACLNSNTKSRDVVSIPGAEELGIRNFRVKGLYTVGAPGFAKHNAMSEECIPGARMYNFGDRMDAVPAAAAFLGYVHPKVMAIELHPAVEDSKVYRCDSEEAKMLPYLRNDVKLSSTLHKVPIYMVRLRELAGKALFISEVNETTVNATAMEPALSRASTE
jgi:pimeloyl-ACP methyl ester carboxylesterase